MKKYCLIFVSIFLFFVFNATLSQALDVNSCRNLNISNTNYVMTQSVYNTPDSVCFTISANNITLDGNGFNITSNYDLTQGHRGIYSSGSVIYSNITLKNLFVKMYSQWGGRAIELTGLRDVLINNTIIVEEFPSFVGTAKFGILLNNVNNSQIKNTQIIPTYSGNGNYGFYGTNIFNNNLTNVTININANYYNAYSYAFSINDNFSSNNLISNSTIKTTGGLYTYLSTSKNPSNKFSATNFSDTRSILFSDTSSFFTYRENSSYDSYLTTNISETSDMLIYRKITQWDNSTVNLTDSSNQNNTTVFYNFSGLHKNKKYIISNTSNSVTTNFINLTSDANGQLSIFSILLNGTTEVVITTDIQPPFVFLQSPQNKTYTTTNISINYTATDANLNTTWYQYNGTNTILTENTTFTALNNQQSTLILYANDSEGNVNSTSVTFSVDATPPSYTQFAINSTNIRKNDSLKFSALWNDLFAGLSKYWFSWNITGTQVNNTPTTFSTNWSNMTFQVTANKSQNISYIIYANDSYGNLNQTTQGSFTINNTAPVVTATIFPSPAQVQDLNCTYSFSDIDLDTPQSIWFQWFVNDILNETTQNLSAGNLSLGDNVKCSVKANDGTDNSSWTNSSEVTIGDTTAPVFINNSDTINPATGNYDSTIPFLFTINLTEANTIDYVYLEITTPDAISQNKTMVQQSHGGSAYVFNYSFLASSVGTYTFVLYAQDGSGNSANYTSDLTYVSTQAETPSGGGGGSTTTAYNYTISAYPMHAEISKYSLGATAYSIQIKNSGSQDAVIRIKATTGAEYFVNYTTTLEQDAAGYFTLPSGAETSIFLNLDLSQAGTYLLEFSLQDKNGADVLIFDAKSFVFSRTSTFSGYWVQFRKNLMYPLVLSTSASKAIDFTRNGIVMKSRENTAIPIGIFLLLLSLAFFNSLVQRVLQIKKFQMRQQYATEIVLGVALVITLVIFVSF